MSFWETLSEIVRVLLFMSATGSIITMLLFALKPIIKGYLPKSVQYYLWVLVLAAFLVPFSIFVSLPFTTPMAPIQNIIESNVKSTSEWQNQISMELYGVPYTQLDDPEQVNVSYREFKERNIGNYNFLLPYILILGIVSLLKELVQYNIYLFNLKRKRFPARINELNILSRNSPRLFRNPLASTPMLVGLFRPVIYLPDREYSERQLQNILLHELTHWRRHDVVIKWIATIAVSVHWYNPFAYLVRREIDRACELACDEAVISNLDTDGKQGYGDTLIDMATDVKKSKVIVSTTMCEEKKTLKDRLSAIMYSKKHTKTVVAFSCVLLTFALCGTVILGASTYIKNNINNDIVGLLIDKGLNLLDLQKESLTDIYNSNVVTSIKRGCKEAVNEKDVTTLDAFTALYEKAVREYKNSDFEASYENLGGALYCLIRLNVPDEIAGNMQISNIANTEMSSGQYIFYSNNSVNAIGKSAMGYASDNLAALLNGYGSIETTTDNISVNTQRAISGILYKFSLDTKY